MADSQNLTADIWVELALAAAATTRLRLGPGVTNPVTRDVAVSACCGGNAAGRERRSSDARFCPGRLRAESDRARPALGRGVRAPAANTPERSCAARSRLANGTSELDPLACTAALTRRCRCTSRRPGAGRSRRRAARRRCRPHGRSGARAAALGRRHRARRQALPAEPWGPTSTSRWIPTETEPASLSAAASRRSPGSPRNRQRRRALGVDQSPRGFTGRRRLPASAPWRGRCGIRPAARGRLHRPIRARRTRERSPRPPGGDPGLRHRAPDRRLGIARQRAGSGPAIARALRTRRAARAGGIAREHTTDNGGAPLRDRLRKCRRPMHYLGCAAISHLLESPLRGPLFLALTPERPRSAPATGSMSSRTGAGCCGRPASRNRVAAGYGPIPSGLASPHRQDR